MWFSCACARNRCRPILSRKPPNLTKRLAAPAGILAAPDLRVTGCIDRVNLQRCVEQLPPGYRTVFVLHDVQGYEHNEIANIMGCSIGNSKSQLPKARMRLRELLQETQRDLARQERQEAKSDSAGVE